jgi:hypothetical protein
VNDLDFEKKKYKITFSFQSMPDLHFAKVLLDPQARAGRKPEVAYE